MSLPKMSMVLLNPMENITFTRYVSSKQSTMAFLIFLIILLVCPNNIRCQARDTITVDHPLFDNGETVVSATERFELGFFSPEGNSTRYVGIWYYKRSPRTYVWIANRNNSLPNHDSGSSFAIDELDGMLKVFGADRTTIYFSTENPPTKNSSVKLLDSGNLVLLNQDATTQLWQSFEHPTDTFLPGMVMNEKLKLSSWFTPSNPASGAFIFQTDQEYNEFYSIKNGSKLYWRSGEPDLFSANEITDQVAFLLTNSTTNSIYVNFSNSNFGDNPYNKRLSLNSTGKLEYYNWGDHGWSLIWSAPHNTCSEYNYCGNFGICSNEYGQTCNCAPGFEPRDPDNFQAGCQINSPPCSSRDTERDSKFSNLPSMVVGKPSELISGPKNETECRKECLIRYNCECQAYSFRRGTKNAEDRCYIWTTELVNLQAKLNGEGHNLSVRVASDRSYYNTSESSWTPSPKSVSMLVVFVLVCHVLMTL